MCLLYWPVLSISHSPQAVIRLNILFILSIRRLPVLSSIINFNTGFWGLVWLYFDLRLLQGATIKAEEDTGKIVIARIMHGGAADRSGLIHIGDEVVEVNNVNVEGKTPNYVLRILVTISTLNFMKFRGIF